MLAPPPIEDFHTGITTVHMHLASLYRKKHVNQSASDITESLIPFVAVRSRLPPGEHNAEEPASEWRSALLSSLLY